jgi:hypothetical protein
MQLSDEDKEFLDNADPEEFRQALVAVLRKADGAELRNLLRGLRANPDSNAKALYEKLVEHPALRDLVPQ